MPLENHPLRAPMTNELHARPFPIFDAPTQIAYLALEAGEDDLINLQSLLAALGGELPEGTRNYAFVEIGDVSVRWERHTEFVTYSIFKAGAGQHLFSNDAFEVFPKAWLDGLPNKVMTSVKVDVLQILPKGQAEKAVITDLQRAFQSESLAVAYVLDQDALIASDFHMDVDGHVCFALVPIGQVGRQRIGRISQRLVEIETYRAMTMLTLPIARQVFARVNELDNRLALIVQEIKEGTTTHEKSLDALMEISTEIEFLSAEHDYRFGGAEAYSKIVDQRILVLREERFMGRQTFSEFMMRRFSPSVRTCAAAQARLQAFSKRAARAADLLGTRVNVNTTEQNRELLQQMDRRAALQLRLQETVEGLSVVAISYYGVNLLSYLLGPVAYKIGLDKPWVTAALVIPVVVLVWLSVRRIRKRMDKE